MPMVLKVILSILGIALLLVVITLLLPVHVFIKTGSEDFVSAKVRILFFTITPKSDKNKEEKKDAESGGKIASFFGFSDFKSFNSIKEKLARSGLSNTVSSLLSIVVDLIKRAASLAGKCKIHRLYVKIICASEDAAAAAIEYGTVCALVYPAVSFISSSMKTKKKALDINIACGYDDEKPSFEFDTHFSVRVFYIVKAILGIIFENAKKEIKNGR